VRVTVPYGDSVQTAVVADQRLAGVVGSVAAKPRDEEAVLAAALASPVGAPPLDELLRGASGVLVVVNDATRPTPTARMLRVLAPLLGGRPVTVAVATGAHRPPTEAELRVILGDLPAAPIARVHVHDARDAAAHARLGTTSRGTPVEIDRVALAAERMVVLSSVEPHYFAGYTGGRKSVLPGMASFTAIEANHAHAMSDEARPLRLAGNPVHEDMAEAADLALGGRVFAVNVVLGTGGRMHAAAAGGLRESLDAIVPEAESTHAPTVPRREAVVVAAMAPPLDTDLYQAQKALEHGQLALEDGGTLILVSPCHCGIGEDAWARALAAARTPEEAEAAVAGPYRFGNHKVARIARAVRRFRIVAVTGIAPRGIESLFMTPAPDLQTALDDALARRPGGRVLVIPDAAHTVPRVAAR